jgi:hypothetical protein
MNTIKLSPVGLGMSFGVLWGISLLVVGLLATYYSYGHPFVTAVGNVYMGLYVPTVRGSLIGGLIGFVDAFFTGFLVAWLYNIFSCCPTSCVKDDSKKKKH